MEDNNEVQARLHMMDFKAATEGTEDPELVAMRATVQQELRGYSLVALDRLDQSNGSLLAQRLGNLELNYYDKKTASANSSLISLLRHTITAGHADTIEEAMTYLEDEHLRLQEEFRDNPVVLRGWDINLLYQAPRLGSTEASHERQVFYEFIREWHSDASYTHPEVPNVEIHGGMLRTSSGNHQPLVVRVTIGTEGGIIRRDNHNAYYFPPSDSERVVIIERSGGVRFPQGMRHARDYQTLHHSDRIQRQFGELRSQGDVSMANYPLRYESLFGRNGHWTNIGLRDRDFQTLYSLETRDGLEAMATPASRRSHLLSVAQDVRHRNGSYAVAGQILEQLFAEPLQAALGEIPQSRHDSIVREVSADRSEFRSQVLESLSDVRESNPEAYQARFPEGAPTEEQINQFVNVSMQAEVQRRLTRVAFEGMQADFDSGAMRRADPIAADAWEIYEDMKDPLDDLWNLSDESVDAIVTEVVITAVTLPLAMGAGTVIRGAAATRLGVSHLLTNGQFMWRTGLTMTRREMAAMALTVSAGSVAEGFAIEGGSSLIQQRDFSWGNAGFASFMSGAFHAGSLGWSRANPAVARFLRVNPQNRGFNFAGELTTQTSMATGMTYASDLVSDHQSSHSFWERLGGETIRNLLGMHYGRWVSSRFAPGGYDRVERAMFERRGELGEQFGPAEVSPVLEVSPEVTRVEGNGGQRTPVADPEVTFVEGNRPPRPVADPEGTAVEGNRPPRPVADPDSTFVEGGGDPAAGDRSSVSRGSDSRVTPAPGESLPTARELPTESLQRVARSWERDVNAFLEYFAEPDAIADLQHVADTDAQVLQRELGWQPEQVAALQADARNLSAGLTRVRTWMQRMQQIEAMTASPARTQAHDALVAEVQSHLNSADIRNPHLQEAVRRMAAGEMPANLPTLLEGYTSAHLRPNAYNQMEMAYMDSIQRARRAMEPLDVFLIGESLRSEGSIGMEHRFTPMSELGRSTVEGNVGASYRGAHPERFIGVDLFVQNPAGLPDLVSRMRAEGWAVHETTTPSGQRQIYVEFVMNPRTLRQNSLLSSRMEVRIDVHLSEAAAVPSDIAAAE